MKQGTFLACTTAIAALTAMPAHAQDRDSDIVVTAQRQNQTQVTGEGSLGALGNKLAEDVPFQVRSYNEALILNQQPQTLGQVLENDPTVRTSYGFGNASEQFVIRGFTLTGDDVGLNGLYGIAPRQLVAPELFQSVQVLNGASAFLNGAAPGGSGVGGSVNLQLKRAGDNPLTRATLGYTSDSHFGGSFDVARRFGEGEQFGLRVNGAFRSGDVSIDNEFRRTMVIGAAFDWRSDNMRFTLDAGYQKVEVDQLRAKVRLGEGVAVPRPPKPSHNFAQPWTHTEMRDIFGTARFEYDFAENAMFYATGGARDGHEEGVYGGIILRDAITGDGDGTGSIIPYITNNETVETGVRVKLGSAVTHEFNVGANMIWQESRSAYDFLVDFDTNLYNAPAVPLPGSNSAAGDLNNPIPVSRNRLWSIFASDTVGFWDDRILLTAGLRLQTMRAKSFNYDDGSLTSVYDQDAITPVVGIVVKPAEGVSLYANRIEGLQQGRTAPIDDELINSGEVFAPFKSTQYEVGGKVRFGKFDASVAVFQIEQPSAFAVPVDPANLAGRRIFGMFGEQRNRGIEFTLAGEPTDGLRVIGGLSVIDAELRKTAGGLNDGNEAAGVPDFTANGNVEWDLPFVPGLTLTGRAVYTGSQKVNVANTLEIGDWVRFDLGARYVFLAAEKPVTLRFTVDNVANERYWASAFDTSSVSVLQGAPRTFKASASIDF